ncbi:MAG: 2-C-methyl-D-erythritol 2,4-cyclodiphosphate synthase [Acidobacteriota bacterium]
MKDSFSFRIGTGYDIHRLSSGRQLILAGVELPFDQGLVGHSDADVVTHAICDALLGAAALRDIGHHFPNNDPSYAGISSLELLARVRQLLRQEGYEISNIDVTVHAQRPRLSSFIDVMCEKLAATLNINLRSISIKAKTNEGLDSVGRSEAIAASAIALIYRPADSSTP